MKLGEIKENEEYKSAAVKSGFGPTVWSARLSSPFLS